MTSKRNLGPILAAAGGVLAVAAVVTGFIVVGGPGDARDRRLDEITQSRINNVVVVVQCAFNATGEAPMTLAAAKATPRPTGTDNAYPLCQGNEIDGFEVGQGLQPAGPGDITYERTGPMRINVCGNFRVPLEKGESGYYAGMGYIYPQLEDARPRGVHCYAIDLAEAPAKPTSHAGHMGDFE